MDVEKLKSDLKEYNQDHLLHFWDKLTDDEKQLLARDISSIDLKQVCKYFSDAVASLGEGAKKLDDLMKPLPDDVCGRFTDENENLLKDYEGEGLKAIWQGQVAVLLLAGGQGTRLGVKYPKGMYVVDIPSGKSLFQLQAERIRRLQTLATDRYGASDGDSDSGTHGIITWYIMTSAPTRKMTEDYFVQHSYFGLLPSQVKFFMQGTLPCFDFQCQAHSANELFSLSKWHEIRREENCMDVSGRRSGAAVQMFPCHGEAGNQLWTHVKDGTIVHKSSGKCLDVAGVRSGGDVVVQDCTGADTQLWQFQHYTDLMEGV